MANGSEVWPVVHAERARLVNDLSNVPSGAWTTPSLCAGWDVHDVLAHLVDTAKTSRAGFITRMVLARMNFDRDNEQGMRREKTDDPNRTLDAMRAALHLTLTPPAPFATRFVEAFVHGEDIRRPLGIPND
jgi:uncharacterized protein (TIGR03083 family)